MGEFESIVMDEIIAKLNRLADLQAQMNLINLRFDELRDSVLSPEQKTQLQDIEDERKTTLESVQVGIASLESEIKEDVAKCGSTVKGAHLQAVFQKGRVKWDDRALAGYAVSHPEITAFRSEGMPSVSLRRFG